MASNSLLTISMITNETLDVLHNDCSFLRGVDRQYDSRFGNTGAQIGAQINIRKPARYFLARTQALQVQSTQEEYATLTLDKWYQTGMNFSVKEMSLDIDEFSNRIIKPAIAVIASGIDSDGLDLFRTAIYNQVGTAGYTPGATGGSAGTYTDSSAPRIFLNAGALLSNFAVPKKDRRVVYGPDAQASSVAGLSGLLNDQSALGKQYLDGDIQHALGFDFMVDQNYAMLSTGSHAGSASANVRGASQTGSSLITQGWTASQTGILLAGETFTIDGVYSVNPETQRSTGKLQTFLVTADANSVGSGYSTLSISPSIVVAGTGVANGTVTNSPSNTAVITLTSGAASKTNFYPLYGAFHRDAFTFGTADLELPNSVEFAGRAQDEGVSLSIVKAYDINSHTYPCRVDVLGGWLAQRPEMACRILG